MAAALFSSFSRKITELHFIQWRIDSDLINEQVGGFKTNR